MLSRTDDSAVTLAILAGGEGKRMGRPKGGLQIAGKSVLEYLLNQYGWPGKTILVTAPGIEHPAGWQQFSAEVTDEVAGEGPLRGVLTALDHVRTAVVIVTTVDMPCIRAEHLQWLLSQLAHRPGCLGMMLRRGDGSAPHGLSPKRFGAGGDGSGNHVPGNFRDSFLEPFPFACRTEARETIRAVLANGGRAMRTLLDEPGFSCAPAPDEWPDSVWTNLNHPEELRQFLKTISR